MKQLSHAPFASFLSPNVVAISQELAQPTQLATALADSARTVRQVTVVDGQTFLADWEEGAKLPKKLTRQPLPAAGSRVGGGGLFGTPLLSSLMLEYGGWVQRNA